MVLGGFLSVSQFFIFYFFVSEAGIVENIL